MKMLALPGSNSLGWRGVSAILSVAMILLLGTTLAGGAMLSRGASSYHPGYSSGVVPKITVSLGDSIMVSDDNPIDTLEVARATWIGVGDLQKFTITNAGLLGLYEQPPSWSVYDGTWPDDITNWNGYCAEFPGGSRQFYTFSTSPWIGVMYPYTLGGQTTYQARVATGAYTPDMCPLSQLRTSDQVFPPLDENAGANVYAPSGGDPLPYQARWPFADSGAINPRRREAFGSNEYDMDPANGDIVSLQDTYCRYGDWVPEELGRFLWPAFGYDTEPLGIRVEQRTYSWSYGASSSYIFINFKIWNMNTFPLDSVYFGFFMDNDVGPGALEEEGVGPNDDLIGYDEALKLGYTYDSNLTEPGWATSAGYIGCVFVETPTNPGEEEEVGLTAFSTWVRSDQGPEGIVDDEQQDEKKYGELVGDDGRGQGYAIAEDPDPAVFEIFETPRDVRHLSGSGPYRQLSPSVEMKLVGGEEVAYWYPDRYVSWTVAIVMGRSLSELKENTRQAQTHFDNGYIGTAPPPPPVLTLTAGDGTAFLTWDDSPEDEEDVITRIQDFEGYRVYRSTSGLPGSWEQLAEYDIAGDSTGKAVQVKYTRGNSVVDLGFDGFYPQARFTYVAGEYLVEFSTDTSFTVYNATQQTLYRYNQAARDSLLWNVFCVVDPDDPSISYPPPVAGNEYVGPYVDGALIYMNGFYFHIGHGEPSEQHPPGTLYHPQGGDLFTVRTFLSAPIGEQNDLFYSYTDRGLTNGLRYYYSVTSFDRGLLQEGLESLESAQSGTKYSLIPRSDAADVFGTTTWSTLNGRLTHFSGTATGSLFVSIAQPAYLTGHDYTIAFLRATEVRPKAGYWRLTDQNTGIVLLDSMEIGSSADLVQPTPDVIDGLRFRVQGDEKANIDTIEGQAGMWTRGNPGYDFRVFGGLEQVDPDDPYDFELTFPVEGTIDKRGNPVPWKMTNISMNEEYETTWLDIDRNEAWSDGDRILVYNNKTPQKQIIQLNTEIADSTRPPDANSVYSIVTNKPFTDADEYRFSSNRQRSEYSLDDITVVPNPYYIRAPWDSNRFNQWIYFQHLPSHCTIRIFTVAGLLIRTLRHDSPLYETGQSSGEGSATWDLLTEENMRAVSGLYIYQVESDDGKTAVGKFAIIR
jgi:hypothetical protein